MYYIESSYRFRLVGIILGLLIFFITAALFSVELGRIYTGSINRGLNDSNSVYQYLIYTNNIIGYNGDLSNPKPENRWIWPWSTATLLFSLVFFATGILGIISGIRESYSSILIFFICSLLSVFLMIFLIATYSTIIAGWKTIYDDSLPYYANIDRKCSIACLALSCLLFILFIISLILAGSTIKVCTQKVYRRPGTGYGYLIATPGLRHRTPISTPHLN